MGEQDETSLELAAPVSAATVPTQLSDQEALEAASRLAPVAIDNANRAEKWGAFVGLAIGGLVSGAVAPFISSPGPVAALLWATGTIAFCLGTMRAGMRVACRRSYLADFRRAGLPRDLAEAAASGHRLTLRMKLLIRKQQKFAEQNPPSAGAPPAFVAPLDLRTLQAAKVGAAAAAPAQLED